MTELVTDANLPDPDGFYDELLKLHQGCSKDESDAINARLILLLANHIGDRNVLTQAFAIAVGESSNTEPESQYQTKGHNK